MEDMNDRDSKLSAALRQLARGDEATLSTSPSVEAHLRAQLRTIRSSRARRQRTLVLALAAAILIAVGMPALWWAMTHRATSEPTTASEVASPETTTAFFPLFFGSVPTSGSHLVRMELPPSALARFGLAAANELDRTAATVLADVLIGDDGLARAVRFVRRDLHQEQNR